MQKFNYHSHTYRCMHSDADMLDEDYIKDYIKWALKKLLLQTIVLKKYNR